MDKRIEIYISKLGRRRKYIGISKNGRGYPAVYFRKSKWATEEEFETILDYLLEQIK